MNFEKYSTEIIIAVITAIAGGCSLLIKKKIKQRNNKVQQSNITINGNNGKVIGGDDNSTN